MLTNMPDSYYLNRIILEGLRMIEDFFPEDNIHGGSDTKDHTIITDNYRTINQNVRRYENMLGIERHRYKHLNCKTGYRKPWKTKWYYKSNQP
jgi:hypothetical protein